MTQHTVEHSTQHTEYSTARSTQRHSQCTAHSSTKRHAQRTAHSAQRTAHSTAHHPTHDTAHSGAQHTAYSTAQHTAYSTAQHTAYSTARSAHRTPHAACLFATAGARALPAAPGTRQPPEVSRTDGGRTLGCCRPRRPGRPDRCPARCRRPQRRPGGPAGPAHPAETSGDTPNATQNRPDFWEVSAMVRGHAGLRGRSDRLQGGPGHPADGPVRWGGAGTTTGGASGCTRSVGQIK